MLRKWGGGWVVSQHKTAKWDLGCGRLVWVGCGPRLGTKVAKWVDGLMAQKWLVGLVVPQHKNG